MIRGRAPPFDPAAVVAEYAALLKQYRITTVTGDNYSAEWVGLGLQGQRHPLRPREQNKCQLYLEALPLFMRRAISIPDHPRLIRELRLLERRVGRVGRDTIDHPKNAAATTTPTRCAGCCAPARSRPGTALYRGPAWDGLGGYGSREAELDAEREFQQARLFEYVNSGGGRRPW